jgi:NarL family two-component system sensor histidine kinase LiaS
VLAFSLWRLQRRLARQVQEQRQDLSADIHDQLNPLLATINFRIERLKADQQLASPEWDQLQHDLQATAQNIRSLSRSLQLPPPDLDHFRKSVQSTCQQIAQSFNFNIEFYFDIQEHRLPRHTRKDLYNIIQELVYNSVRHSKGAHIFVRLIQDNDQCQIRYWDDGQGWILHPQKTAANGINNICRRVQRLRGMFHSSLQQPVSETAPLTIVFPLA